MMTKQQTIDKIRERNHTASPEFLAGFNAEALSVYLCRLDRVANHRGPDSRWVRITTSPAVTTRHAA